MSSPPVHLDNEGERARILAEYERRRHAVNADLYAPWNLAHATAVAERKRVAAALLHRRRRFPGQADRCLEVGVGKLGWLADLVSWGVPASMLYGIDLDATRIAAAQATLPCADLRCGDATELPWQSHTFSLVVCSTVFSSILDENMRGAVAHEITRVLAPSGAILWYDFAYRGSNPHVRGVKPRQAEQYFPGMRHEFRRVTLAPPIARLAAPGGPLLEAALSAVYFFRTHFVGVFTY